MSSQLPNGLWADFQPFEDARVKANANFNQLDWSQWKCINAQIALADLPVLPAVGDSYLVDATSVYIWYNAQWNILTPPCGWIFYDQTLNEFFWNVGGITSNLALILGSVYNYVVGPLVSVVNHIPVFDNITGNLIKDSGILLDFLTTAPVINRAKLDVALQIEGSTGPILRTFGDGKTLIVGDSTTGVTRPSVVSADPSSYGLMIVRGNVDSTGALTGGEGFTSIQNFTGNYTVTFTDAFFDNPTIVLTSTLAFGLIIVLSSSTTNFVVENRNAVTTAVSDTDFSFIAIGQRGA